MFKLFHDASWNAETGNIYKSKNAHGKNKYKHFFIALISLLLEMCYSSLLVSSFPLAAFALNDFLKAEGAFFPETKNIALQNEDAVNSKRVSTTVYKRWRDASALTKLSAVIVVLAIIFVTLQCYKSLKAQHNYIKYDLTARSLAAEDEGNCAVSLSSPMKGMSIEKPRHTPTLPADYLREPPCSGNQVKWELND